MADLKVRIIGTLNAGASIGEINTAIKGIEKKINKIKLNVSIDDNLSKNIEKLSKQINNLHAAKPAGNQNPLGNINTQAQQATTSVNNLGNAFQQAFTKFPIWMLTSSLFYAPIRGAEQFIDTLYLLDERLVSIDKVLDNADLSSVFNNATEAAYEFGRTVDGALQSLGEISKLGFNEIDAEALNKNALLLSTVGEFKSDADAANYLVAIMRQYKLTVADTTKVVDALNSVSNQTGADTEGLAQALSKASSSAATAGVSFHELSGMASSTIETLKISGNEAGTFYKTLFSRYLRDSTQNALQAVGIQTKDMNGELRSATDVLQDLGKAWSGFDSQTKNSIASALGGGWHINKVSSLLENQQNVLKNTEFSIDSYQSATNELATFQEGLAFKTNNMIASFQELAWTIGENGARDGLVKLLELTTSMTQGFNALTESTNGWNIKLPLLAAGIYGVVKAAGALRLAITGIKSSFGIFSVGILAVEALASVFMKSTNAGNLHTEALTQSAEATAKNTNEIQYLVSRYKELESQSNGSTEKQQELQDVLKQIQAIAPHLISSTGKYGETLSLNKTKTDEYIESLKAMTAEQVAQAKAANEIELSMINVDLEKEKSKLKDLASESKTAFEEIQSYQSKYDVKAIDDAQNEFDNRIAEIAKKAQNAYDIGDENSYQKYMSQLAEMREEFSSYIKLLQNPEALNDYADKLTKVNELEAKKKGIQERNSALDELTNSTNSSTTANSNNADSLDTVAEGTYDLEEGMDSVSGAIDGATAAMNSNASAAENLAGITSDSLSSLKSAIGTYEVLSQMENLSSAQKDMLSAATEQLSEAYPELTKNSKINVAQVRNEMEANEILLEATEKLMNGELKADDATVVSKALSTKSKISEMQKEISAMEVTAKAIDALKQHYIDLANSDTSVGMLDNVEQALAATGNANADITSEISSLKSELESLKNTSAGYTSQLRDITDYQSEAEKATEESNKTTEESIYITDKYKQSLEKLSLELAKIQSKKNDYAQYSKKYQNAIKEEIKLLEQQQKLNKQQTADLNAQIKSGNVVQYGKVSSSSSSGSKYSGQYSSYINDASSKYGVDSSLIAAIIKQESSFNANARSSAGAMGLMQLMPGTAKELGVNNAYDAYQNIMGGTKYISQLLDKYNGSVEKALWAYNAGMGNVNNIVNSSANEWKGAKSYASKVLSYFEDYGGAVQASTAKATKAIDGFSGTITSTYGTRTRNGKTETHRGIDIAGNKGDKIGATTAGTVTYAGWGKSGTGYGNYGNVVAVTAADGKTYLYAHLDSTKVKKGDKVGVNQTIGTMGNTGDSNGVHLHYEVRTNGYGTDINPMSSVQAARNGTYTGSAADQASAIDGAKSEVNQLAQDALSLQDQIEELNMALVESVLAGYDHNKNQWEDDLAQIDLIQSSVAETDKKWIDQQLKKESIVRKQLEQEQLSIAYLKDQIKHNKALTEAQKAQLSDNLLQRTQDMISLEQQLLDERTQMADTIIDTYKQSLEAIKDAQLKQIDEIIDGINKEADEADYAKQLKDAQTDRQGLLDQIAKLALSSSPADKAKLAELQKQLEEQDESIADMQTDRAKELRIDNLNEQKDDIQTNYDNLVNDEKKFAQMRSDIINANTKQIEKDLGKYYTNIKSNTSLLGKAMSNNLIDLINQANRYLNGKDYKPIKIASAAKGGILPSWGNEGKAMVVHEEEMISTKHDTKNLLAAMSESSKLMDTLKSLDMGKTLANASMNLLTSFKLPSTPSLSPSVSNVNNGATYQISFGDIKVTGTKDAGKQVMDQLVNEMRLLGAEI